MRTLYKSVNNSNGSGKKAQSTQTEYKRTGVNVEKRNSRIKVQKGESVETRVSGIFSSATKWLSIKAEVSEAVSEEC